jgi:hypothetical protein
MPSENDLKLMRDFFMKYYVIGWSLLIFWIF